MLVLVDLILSMFIKFPLEVNGYLKRRERIFLSRILKVKIKFYQCHFKLCLNLALFFCSLLEHLCTLFESYLPSFNPFKK